MLKFEEGSVRRYLHDIVKGIDLIECYSLDRVNSWTTISYPSVDETAKYLDFARAHGRRFEISYHADWTTVYVVGDRAYFKVWFLIAD